jgi:gluconolactonase
MIELATNLQFPEGPIACPDGSVLVVQIASGQLSRCGTDGRVVAVAELGGGPNGAALGPDGKCYVCNNGGMQWHRDPNGGLYPHGRAPDYKGGSIQRVDIGTGAVQTLYDSVASGPLLAPNDIVFDDAGGFWFTDLGSIADRHIERGRVCYATTDGSSIREVVFPMLTPNGIGLSPDGSKVYVAETVTARVWQFEVVAPGELALAGWPASSPGTLLYAAPHFCSFDSLAVEADGNVCVATLGTGGVTVISPAGKLVEFVKFADRATTNLCFGGPTLTTAYITQSRSGRLLGVPWPRKGFAPPFSGLHN